MTLSTPKSHSALLFVTPVGQAYTCLRDVEILLTNSNTDVKATVLLRELEIQPFLFKDNNFGPGELYDRYEWLVLRELCALRYN